LLLPFLAFPIFYHLTEHPIFNWDESRQAINMLEMIEKANPLVTSFEGLPDHYNTKPPLLIWIQTSIYLISGRLELAMRLPSALAALTTCFVLIWFATKHLKRPLVGGFAALILVSISGYIELHGTRTGDYDSLITLWILLFSLHYYLFISTALKQHLYQFYLFFALGIATKASVPFLTLPILFICTLASQNLLNVLKNKHTYIGLLIPISALILFYPIREQFDPGYMNAAWHNDFGGRYNTAIDGHAQPYNYYYQKLWVERARYFIWIFPLMLLYTLFSKKQRIKSVVILSASFVVGFTLTLSQSVTKIYWYDTPIYPFLALMLACAFRILIMRIETIKHLKVIAGAVLLGLLTIPYLHNAKKSIKADRFSWEGPEFYEPSYLLKRAISGEKNLKNHKLLFDNDYFPHYEVYNTLLEKKQGYKISYRQYLAELSPADTIIYFQAHRFKDSLKNCFQIQILDSINPYIKIFTIQKLTCQTEQQTFPDKQP